MTTDYKDELATRYLTEAVGDMLVAATACIGGFIMAFNGDMGVAALAGVLSIVASLAGFSALVSYRRVKNGEDSA